MQTAQRFVFLEFTNPKIRDFLTDLRASLLGSTVPAPVHITVRGPYKELPSADLLSALDEKLRGYGVLINGAGTFSHGDAYTVYLKAQSPVFEEIWWKRDFPATTFGIQPHISIFESKNAQAARTIEKFLRGERIELFTFGLRLTVRASKQLHLFEVNAAAGFREALERWERIKVKPGVLARAKELRSKLVSIL